MTKPAQSKYDEYLAFRATLGIPDRGTELFRTVVDVRKGRPHKWRQKTERKHSK